MDNKFFAIAMAALPLCITLYHFIKKERLRKTGLSATGEITRFESDNDGGRLAFIRFKTLSGDVIEKKYNTSVRANTKIGDVVQINYNPSKPTNFVINNSWERRILMLIIFISTIVFLGTILFVF